MLDVLTSPTVGLIGSLGWLEVLAIASLGVLIFGKRLPEVGRSIGRSMVEFKRGLSDSDDDRDQANHQQPLIEAHEEHKVSADTQASK